MGAIRRAAAETKTSAYTQSLYAANPRRSDDRRTVENSESRSEAFSGGYFAQREAQAQSWGAGKKREANREDNISTGRLRHYERMWGKP